MGSSVLFFVPWLSFIASVTFFSSIFFRWSLIQVNSSLILQQFYRCLHQSVRKKNTWMFDILNSITLQLVDKQGCKINVHSRSAVFNAGGL